MEAADLFEVLLAQTRGNHPSEMVPERAPRQVFHVSAQAEIAIQHQTSKSPNIGFCAQTGDPAFLEILGFLLE
jgi:hypothetical protein